jgi:isopenicillin N synthase-like dioxygenase
MIYLPLSLILTMAQNGTLEMKGRWGLIPPVDAHYETFSTFQRQCDYVTRMLLDRISNAMGLNGESSLNRFHRGDNPSKSATAFLHYIPMDHTGANVGHNMHTDYGTLTLVFAYQWGLQVLMPSGPLGEDREWQWVAPRPGHAIVNVADALRFLTGGKLISAVHRVLPLPDDDRYSVTYFLRPSDDTMMPDINGNIVNVMDWYQNKNKMYEVSAKAQDQSMLIGGLYKDKFGNNIENDYGVQAVNDNGLQTGSDSGIQTGSDSDS